MREMLKRMKLVPGALALLLAAVFAASAQTASGSVTVQRGPSSPTRPVVVLSARSLGDLEKRLRPEAKTEDLIGGEGMELRVAVTHEREKPPTAEVHDASDDVYYVLEGSATLTMGGKLDSGAHEIEPGEWRAKTIVGGQNYDIRKGDLVVVPRGTPHMRSTVGKTFSMILIKVFADPLPAPKPKPAEVKKP